MPRPKLPIESVECRVCNVPCLKRWRNGAYVCESCRRFYLRNRDKADGLTCESGDGVCLAVLQKLNAKAVTTTRHCGAIVRSICPACRLKKCLEIGMRSPEKRKADDQKDIAKQHEDVKDFELSASSNNYASTFEPLNIFCPENSELEQTISRISLAADQMVKTTALIPARCKDMTESMADPYKSWGECMVLFDSLAKIKTEFIRSLPGFYQIRVLDRCRLFEMTCIQIGIAESCFQPDHPMPLCVSEENFTALTEHMPELSFIPLESWNLWRLFKEWQPTQTELFLCYGLLYFNADSNYFDDLTAISNARMLLYKYYSSYMRMAYGNNDDELQRKTTMMDHLLHAVRDAADRRKYAYSKIVQRYKLPPSKILNEVLMMKSK